MNTVRLTIDGKSVEVDKGASVLDAARKAGVDIPTLCHHPKLEPFGACRMCLVEIEKHGRKRTVASCAFPAEDGLVVTSSTPKIERMRKLIVELLWPAYTTPAKGMKIEKSRFTGALPDCSLCGLCVRYCRDVVKKNALYFQGRGVDRVRGIRPGNGARMRFVPSLLRPVFERVGRLALRCTGERGLRRETLLPRHDGVLIPPRLTAVAPVQPRRATRP